MFVSGVPVEQERQLKHRAHTVLVGRGTGMVTMPHTLAEGSQRTSAACHRGTGATNVKHATGVQDQP